MLLFVHLNLTVKYGIGLSKLLSLFVGFALFVLFLLIVVKRLTRLLRAN
jgi:hypothetical protein